MNLRKIFKFREAGILFALLFIWLVTAIINPRFLSSYNLQLLSRQIAVFGLIAIGETFVILTEGIDLSPGSVIVLTSVLVATFMSSGMGIAAAIVLTLLIAVLIGVWHGIFVTKLRVPPFIITLGTFAMGRGLATVITKGQPVLNLPDSFSFIWHGMLFKFLPFPVFILIIVSGFSIFLQEVLLQGVFPDF